MTHFNLAEQPWIPCRIEGEVVQLGLRDVLARAHQIREIADDSPLTTVALHRLLLALLHRILDGPKDELEWAAVRSAGRFQMEAIDRYFQHCKDRFDLFSSTHPFYQAADIEVGPQDVAAVRIILDRSPNNARMFSNTDDKNPPAFEPAVVARWLIAYLAFRPGGLVAKRYGSGPTSGRAGPLAGAAVVLAGGDTVFDTLLSNLVYYDPSNGLPFSTASREPDLPVWERNTPPDDEQRLPHGYLDWLTWQTSAVRLAPDIEGGRVVVRRAVIRRGNGLPMDVSARRFETMVAFREIKGKTKSEVAWGPVSLRRDRSVWRDSGALLQASANADRPKVLDELAEKLEESGEIASRILPLTVAGVAYDQANALFWRGERLPLPLVYLSDDALASAVQQALALAEGDARALHEAGERLARYLLRIDPHETLTGAKREELTRRLASLDVERRYWAWLGPYFSRYLVDRAVEREADARWLELVERAARSAFDEVADGLGTGGDLLRAAVEGRQILNGRLKAARARHGFTHEGDEEVA